jgi:hypothetical protein
MKFEIDDLPVRVSNKFPTPLLSSVLHRSSFLMTGYIQVSDLGRLKHVHSGFDNIQLRTICVHV